MPHHNIEIIRNIEITYYLVIINYYFMFDLFFFIYNKNMIWDFLVVYRDSRFQFFIHFISFHLGIFACFDFSFYEEML